MWGADRVAEAQAIANLPPAWPQPQPHTRLLTVGNYDRYTPYHHVAADFEEVAKTLTDWWIDRLVKNYDYISPEGIIVSCKAGKDEVRQDELCMSGLNKIDGSFDSVRLIKKTESTSNFKYEVAFINGDYHYGFYDYEKGKHQTPKYLITGDEERLQQDFEGVWLNNPEFIDQMVIALRVAQRVYLQDQLKEVPRPSLAQRIGQLIPELRQRHA